MRGEDRRPLPDGFEWAADGQGIELVMPVTCPRGHPALIVRQDYVRCREHEGHYAWSCSCGADIFRHDGEYWGRLDCVSPNYGQQV